MCVIQFHINIVGKLSNWNELQWNLWIEHIGLIIFVSSAYSMKLDCLLAMWMSFLCKIYTKGPRIEPCGTIVIKLQTSDTVASTSTIVCQLDKQFRKHIKEKPKIVEIQLSEKNGVI